MPRWSQVALSVLVASLLLVGGVLWWRQSLPLPVATLAGTDVPIGRAGGSLTLAVESPAGRLRSAELRLSQGGAEKLRHAVDLSAQGASRFEETMTIVPAEIGLTEGSVDVAVHVVDDQWRPRPDASPRLVATLEVDLTPPTLEFVSATRYVKHAGTGVAAYRVRDAARSGVRVGSREFPGVPGLSSDPDVRVALYTIPYDEPVAEPLLFAEDRARNARTVAAPVNFLPTTFRRDRFNLPPDFMARKVAELTPDADTSTPEAILASYLEINRAMRVRDEARIRDVASAAKPVAPAWSGAFAQQPDSKVFAHFPQERDSVVAGDVVDTQWHLGLDLASTERVPILAANAGEVLFTGDIGIYGNTVVLDHGLGLTSLYSHLSSIAVGLGQRVAKGEPVGISGLSGLAGGDHLHFAMLVHGTYTNPIDWFDAGYLHDRIALPLIDAGIAVPGLTDLPAPSRGRATPKKAARTEGRRR